MRKTIKKTIVMLMTGLMTFSTGYNSLSVKAESETEESSQEDFNERLQDDLAAERYYDEHFYDEEKPYVTDEEIMEGNRRATETEESPVSENGEAIIRAQSTTINGDNLTYIYKITNIPKIDNRDIVIQKSYIGSTYLYYIQSLGQTLYLSRVALPSSGNIINASGAQRMTLSDFGHSQVLEYFEYQGTGYFWIGCKGVSDGETTWSTQIGRITFQAGVTKTSSQIKRLSKMNCANASGSSLGTIRRVEAALSTNKQYLLLWARTYDTSTNSEGEMVRSNVKTRFSIYNASAVNAALTAHTGSNNVDCNSAAIKAACIGSFEFLPGYDNDNFYIRKLRFGSMAGLEISNAKEIYVASEFRQNSQSQGKYIIKLNSTGTILKTTEITGTTMGAGSNTELEGLQIKDSFLYFINKDWTPGSSKYHYIYRITP